MKARKAVIVAAGFGTRMLPASKVIPKEILPVIDTPAIQLVVLEAARSGIEEIIVVTSPGRTTVLEQFRPAVELERHLEERGKTDILDRLKEIETYGARIKTVEQPKPLGLGHAVLCARDEIGNEPFAVMLPDDVFDCERPCLGQLIAAAGQCGAPTVALLRVARTEVSKYGIATADEAGERLYRIRAMVEKPKPEDSPGELAIIGRYILPPEIFPLLADGRPGAGGELQLTDALAKLAHRGPFYGYAFEGTRYDLGDPFGYLMAQVGFGLKRPDLADRFRAYLKSVISS